MDFRGRTSQKNYSKRVSLFKIHYHLTAVAWERGRQGNRCGSKRGLKEVNPPLIDDLEILLTSFSVS